MSLYIDHDGTLFCGQSNLSVNVFVHRPRWFMYLSVFNSYLIIFELSKSDVFRTTKFCLLFFFSFIVFVVGGFFPRGV